MFIDPIPWPSIIIKVSIFIRVYCRQLPRKTSTHINPHLQSWLYRKYNSLSPTLIAHPHSSYLCLNWNLSGVTVDKISPCKAAIRISGFIWSHTPFHSHAHSPSGWDYQMDSQNEPHRPLISHLIYLAYVLLLKIWSIYWTY